MRSHFLRYLAALVFLSTASLPLLAQEKAEGKIVKKIEIEGNHKVHERQIRAVIKTRVGEPYHSDLVDQDVGRIWALEYFQDIKAQALPEGDGLRLVFTVQERTTIAKVTFLGNKALSDSSLLESTDLKVGSFAGPYTLIAAKRRIVDAYRGKGYQFVEVDYKQEEKDGQVEVTFVIAEGPKLRVKRITFSGNKSFKARELLGKMQTKRRVWPLQDGIYKEDVLDSDLVALKDHYDSQGWLDVTIGRELKYNDAKTDLYITIFIQEGERYHVDNLSTKGNDLFTDAEIQRKLKLKSGAPFVRDDLRHDAKAIKDLYGEQGYIDAEVRPKTPLSLQPAKINVVYEIAEGDRIYVERIDIRGNIKTKDHVIRREVTFYPGERFNTKKTEESKARIQNTRLFESYDPMNQVAPVQTDVEQSGPDPLHRTAVFTVQEGHTGELSFGAGISSNVGLIGQFSLTQRNFNLLDLPTSAEDFFSGNAFIGGGQTLSLVAQPGNQRSEYSISFREPSLFDSPYGYGASTYYYQRDRDEYDEERIGGSTTIDRRITRNLRIGLTYAAQNIAIRNVNDQWASQDVIDSEGHTTRLSLELRSIYDTRDNVIMPTKGVKIEPGVELAGTFLGGDVSLIKTEIGAKWYHKLFEVPNWGPHVLSVGVEAGMVDSLDSKQVPIFDRYFIGGPGGAASLRGFAFRGVGPVDPKVREQIGGELQVVTSTEYEFPIVGRFIRGVGFVDAGSIGRYVGSLEDWRVSTGIGLRLTFPQLGYIPIDLDWGVPLQYSNTDEKQTFSFNIGGGLRF